MLIYSGMRERDWRRKERNRAEEGREGWEGGSGVGVDGKGWRGGMGTAYSPHSHFEKFASMTTIKVH
jgi:hypothetical protein